MMELRHHISSLPNHVHEQTGNILNVHVQTGTAAAATSLTNNAYVQTGNILWDDGQTSLGKHLGRLYGTLSAFPLLILFSSSSWCIYYHSRNRTCSQPPSLFTCLVLSHKQRSLTFGTRVLCSDSSIHPSSVMVPGWSLDPDG